MNRAVAVSGSEGEGLRGVRPDIAGSGTETGIAIGGPIGPDPLTDKRTEIEAIRGGVGTEDASAIADQPGPDPHTPVATEVEPAIEHQLGGNGRVRTEAAAEIVHVSGPDALTRAAAVRPAEVDRTRGVRPDTSVVAETPTVIDVETGGNGVGTDLHNEIAAGSGPDPLTSVAIDSLSETQGSRGGNGVGTEHEAEFVPSAGPDPLTPLLYLTSAWQDIQQTRKAAQQRGLYELAESLKTVEERVGRDISKALRAHLIWPWLSQYKGLGGIHVARLIAIIGDPHRFPGQQCSMGHTVAPKLEVGGPCPITDPEGNGCPGRMQEPRTTTGTRSLWHYCGLHVVDGRSPRKQRGQQADWNPKARTALLQPDGIADAIVRNRSAHYRDVYDEAKERLIRERVDGFVATDRSPGPLPTDSAADTMRVSETSIGSRAEAEVSTGIDWAAGLRPFHAAEADTSSEIAAGLGLRPFQIDHIARVIAVKEFLGDLLRELKAVAA